MNFNVVFPTPLPMGYIIPIMLSTKLVPELLCDTAADWTLNRKNVQNRWKTASLLEVDPETVLVCQTTVPQTTLHYDTKDCWEMNQMVC